MRKLKTFRICILCFEKERLIDGHYCFLVAVKVEEKAKGTFFNSDFVRGYYLSEGIHDVKSELETLGEFVFLPFLSFL